MNVVTLIYGHHIKTIVKIFILTLFLILSIVIFIPHVNAESPITPINEKYTIVKNIGLGSWITDYSSAIEINLSDSRNNTAYSKANESGDNTLVVHISDFVATSKGKMSSADNTLSSDSISVLPIKSQMETIEEKNGDIVVNLAGNLTKFKINVLTNEKDTVTYSGKILLKNESMFISIPVDIIIQHDTGELISFGIGGVILGIGIAYMLIGKPIDKFDFTDNKPWVSTAIIAFLAIPVSVFANKEFIGNYWIDIAIAFSIGALVITKLLKCKDKPTANKISFSFDAEEKLPEGKQVMLDKILKSINIFSKT